MLYAQIQKFFTIKRLRSNVFVAIRFLFLFCYFIHKPRCCYKAPLCTKSLYITEDIETYPQVDASINQGTNRCRLMSSSLNQDKQSTSTKVLRYKATSSLASANLTLKGRVTNSSPQWYFQQQCSHFPQPTLASRSI